jgi:hypothetical protein
MYRQGYIPLVQMHDEIGSSVSSEKQGLEIANIMKDVVKLKIPMKVDVQFGHSWGQASQEFKKSTPPSFNELMKYGPKISSEEMIRRRIV